MQSIILCSFGIHRTNELNHPIDSKKLEGTGHFNPICHDAPQNVFNHCAEISRSRMLKLYYFKRKYM